MQLLYASTRIMAKSQRWIVRAAQSGLPTHTAMTESGSLCGWDKKLTEFAELEMVLSCWQQHI